MVLENEGHVSGLTNIDNHGRVKYGTLVLYIVSDRTTCCVDGGPSAKLYPELYSKYCQFTQPSGEQRIIF